MPEINQRELVFSRFIETHKQQVKNLVSKLQKQFLQFHEKKKASTKKQMLRRFLSLLFEL